MKTIAPFELHNQVMGINLNLAKAGKKELIEITRTFCQPKTERWVLRSWVGNDGLVIMSGLTANSLSKVLCGMLFMAEIGAKR